MHLTLHLTNRCNLACGYCYARPGTDDMTAETATRAIETCLEGPGGGIIFFGGEPLLRKDLIDATIRWCEERHPNRFHYKVTTKADGTGTHAELQPRLLQLLRRRPYSPIMLTVNPETVEHYAASVAWLQAQGARYLIASLNHAGPWDDAALRRLKRQSSRLETWHWENYRAERKIYFSPFDKRIATHVFRERGTSCRLGRRQISVSPDGRLYPCVQFVGRAGYEIGTAANGIDETRREAIYALNEQDKPQCAGCALAGRCHNKCGCLNMQTTGSLTRVPALLCEHERMVFPIADRLAGRLFKERSPLFLQRHYNPAFPVLSFLEDIATG